MRCTSSRALTWLLLVLGGAGPLLWAGRSDACTCVGPETWVSPSKGATNVPLNAEIKLLVRKGSGETFQLKDGAEQIAPTAVLIQEQSTEAFVRIRPQSEFSPNTDYALTDSTGTTVTSFRSGSAADHAPPTLDGIASVGHSSIDAGASSCGPLHHQKFKPLEHGDKGTPSSELLFLAYVDSSAPAPDGLHVGIGLRPGMLYLGTDPCFSNFEPNLDTYEVSLRVIDWAGNESLPPGELPPAPKAGCSQSTAEPFWILLVGVLGSLAIRRQRRALGCLHRRSAEAATR